MSFLNVILYENPNVLIFYCVFNQSMVLFYLLCSWKPFHGGRRLLGAYGGKLLNHLNTHAMDKIVIGETAGTVWRTLVGRRFSWNELVAETGISPVELAAAVGWLAREDKISFSQDGDTLFLEIYHEHYY